MMEQWISKEAVVWISGIALTIGVIVIPWILVEMPADVFTNVKRYSWLDKKPASVRIPFRILKNLLAFGLILLGAGMFPILLGVLLADFPGKLKLQRWILSTPYVYERHELAEAQIPTPVASKTESQTGRLTVFADS